MNIPDIIERDNYLDAQEITQLDSLSNNWNYIPSYSKGGQLPEGSLIAEQSWHDWNPDDAVGKILAPKLDQLFEKYRVVEMVAQKLHLPWDVHTDYVRSASVTEPWYTVILPLTECDSRTILFNQRAKYNDFWKFKQQHAKVADPVDLNFWNQNLSHCWDDDREYLTLRYVSRAWKLGNMFSFKRDIIHSSDDFHTRIDYPKKFIQILLDKSE